MSTKISYADITWNPIAGCTAISVACEKCWACRLVATRLDRFPDYHGLARKTEKGRYQWTGEVRLLPHKLSQPLHWRRPRTVFVCSQADLFHEAVPDEFIWKAFGVMAASERHTYLLLTKRPNRMNDLLAGDFARGKTWGAASHFRTVAGNESLPWPLPNVWLGVTVENQNEKWRIDALRETPAALRWLSLEPLLEDLGQVNLESIGWVVVGCESGPRARPMKIEWARAIKD